MQTCFFLYSLNLLMILRTSDDEIRMLRNAGLFSHAVVHKEVSHTPSLLVNGGASWGILKHSHTPAVFLGSAPGPPPSWTYIFTETFNRHPNHMSACPYLTPLDAEEQ